MEKFPVILTDVSKYQDDPDTTKKPDVTKLAAKGILGIFVRVGFGRVMDGLFKWFWSTSKGILSRIPYWYLDYYSNRLSYVNVTDIAWGTEQGANLYNWIKGDPGEAPAVVDCEESSYGGRITIFNKASYNRVLKAMVDEYKRLSGKLLVIYTAPGFIWVFDDWVKDLPLWIAWYDRTKTRVQVVAYCRSKGWRGPILFWQFTSDGDLDGDGIADGLALGMESKELDFNVWFGPDGSGSLQSWSKYCGGTIPAIPPVVPPVIPPVVIPPVVPPVIPPVKLWKDLTVNEKLELLKSKHSEIV